MREKICLFMIFVLLIGIGSIFAQDLKSQKNKSVWINIGFGLGGINKALSLAACLNLTYQSGKNTFTFRRAGCGGIDSEGIGDYSILYGRINHGRLTIISYGIGLGYVYSNEFAGEIKTIGIPLEVQLFFRPFGSFGVGIYGFGNINFKKIYFGACLCLQLVTYM